MIIFENIIVTKIEEIRKINTEKDGYVSFKSRHSHAYVFYLAGVCKYIYENKTFMAGPNKFIYLPKGKAYQIIPPENSNCIVINFQALNDITCEEFVASYSNCTQLKECFEALYNLYMQKKAGYISALLSILYKIINHVQNAEIADYIPKHFYSKIEKAINYINGHYTDENIKISYLAELSNMSIKYFIKLFHSYFNTTPKQYIIDLKLDLAKNLLSSSKTPISEIAEQVGFLNRYYFSKMFKKMTSINPAEYRHNFIAKI